MRGRKRKLSEEDIAMQWWSKKQNKIQELYKVGQFVKCHSYFYLFNIAHIGHYDARKYGGKTFMIAEIDNRKGVRFAEFKRSFIDYSTFARIINPYKDFREYMTSIVTLLNTEYYNGGMHELVKLTDDRGRVYLEEQIRKDL